MRTLCWAIAVALAAVESAQPAEQVRLGGSSVGPGPGQIGFDFVLTGDGPGAALPWSWGNPRYGAALRTGASDSLALVRHYVCGSSNNKCSATIS